MRVAAAPVAGVASVFTGHKDASIFQRYSHPSDSHLKTAVEGLNDGEAVSKMVTSASLAKKDSA